jgi:Ca2+-binding RTX toxin-like protein
LIGNKGADWLQGEAGADTLTGGGGADRFFFADIGYDTNSRDRITDFSSAEADKIDLGPIDAVTGVAGNRAFYLINGDFTGGAGDLRVKVQGGGVTVYADINGDAKADFAVVVLDCNALHLVDFLL